MTSVLIVIAVIVFTALLFWLDRKDGHEKAEAEGMYNEIFRVFNRTRWGMSLGEMEGSFSAIKLAPKEESGDVTCIDYVDVDKVKGHDALLSFYFLKENGNLVGIHFHFHHVPVGKTDLLFSRFSENFGHPLTQPHAEKNSVVWDLESGALTLEVLDNRGIRVRFWDKEFYSRMKQQGQPSAGFMPWLFLPRPYS